MWNDHAIYVNQFMRSKIQFNGWDFQRGARLWKSLECHASRPSNYCGGFEVALLFFFNAADRLKQGA